LNVEGCHGFLHLSSIMEADQKWGQLGMVPMHQMNEGCVENGVEATLVLRPRFCVAWRA